MKAIIVILIIGGFALLGGFIWMISLGALSHIFNIPRLAIGFWPSVLVALIANLLLNAGARSKD